MTTRRHPRPSGTGQERRRLDKEYRARFDCSARGPAALALAAELAFRLAARCGEEVAQ